jgi:conjugal transfer pilus assembly protein TraD
MTESNEFPQTGTQAADSLERSLGGLVHHGLELALAVALGLLAARLMQRRGLHWSWMAAALGSAIVLRSLLGAVAPAVIVALVAGALGGRRVHRRDLDAGGDLAAAARSSRTPLAALRAGAMRWGVVVPARRWGREQQGQRLTLGRELDGRPVVVPAPAALGGHALVVGATGSGKTVTQTLIAVRAIEAGRAAIVIDPKGDRAMREQLRRVALRVGREFVEWSPSGPSVYNPYGRGGDTEIADRVLAGEHFTEPHYLRQAQRYLGHVVRALRASGGEVSLAGIVRLLDPQALELLLRDMPERQAQESHDYLDSLTPRQQRDLAGVRDRLAILGESDVGCWLDPAHKARRFDLLACARSGAIVYFNLESDSRPLLSRMLGAAVVQDLQCVVASLQGRPAPTTVVIDEFAAVAAEQVVALFGRARSAGFGLLLGTQELSDLRLPGRERVLEQVMGNLSLLIAHRQVVPASADLLSRLGGVRGSWRVTWASNGRTTRTRTDEPVLVPDSLMRLAPGWAAVIALGRSRGARLTRIAPVGGERR